MSLYREVAVILRTYKLAEADRVVVLLTRNSGKVRAVAKGVRRTGSKFGSRLEPGSYVDLQLRSSRGDLELVTQAETIESHPNTRSDLRRLGHAAALLEAVDQLSQVGKPDARLHDMLVGGLRVIEEKDPALVVAAFYLRLLAHEGVSPELDRCVVCSEPLERLYWSAEAGGVRCGSCGGGRFVSDESLTVTRAVLGGGLNAVLDLADSPKTHDVESMAAEMLELHIERRLKSLRVVHDSE